jgi:hypothetical protein
MCAASPAQAFVSRFRLAVELPDFSAGRRSHSVPCEMQLMEQLSSELSVWYHPRWP